MSHVVIGPSSRSGRCGHATFSQALRAEWQKLLSLSSFWYTLAATVVIGVGIGTLSSSDAAQNFRTGDSSSRSAFDPTYESLFTGLIFSMLAMVVLGVTVVTSEYATGTIRSSLAAVPRRGRLLAAKATVLTIIGLAVGIPLGCGMFVAGQAVFVGQHVPYASLGQPGVLRAVLGVGVVLTATALLGLGVGTLVRSTAGGSAIMFTVSLLMPTAILPSLPSAVGAPLLKFWPSAAGMQVVSIQANPGALSPVGGVVWLLAVTMVVLLATLAVFRAGDV